MIKFLIEDAMHSDWIDECDSYEAAISELTKYTSIPWDQEPNCAPCTSWRKCGRLYEITTYDKSTVPWKEIDRKRVLEISSQGVKWLLDESEM